MNTGTCGNYRNQNYFMNFLDDIEIFSRLSFETAGIILTVKYHAEISVILITYRPVARYDLPPPKGEFCRP